MQVSTGDTPEDAAASLAQLGFVVLRDVLNPAARARLLELYLQHRAVPVPHEAEDPYQALATHLDPETQRRDFHVARDVCTDLLARLPVPLQARFSVFIGKAPGAPELPFHRDPSFCLPPLRSYGLWCALTDARSAGGGLRVAAGSHLDAAPVRHCNAYFDQERTEPDRVRSLELDAGDALLYDHALVHGSHANRLDSERVALNVGLLPPGAEVCLGVVSPKSLELTAYSVTDEFLETGGPWSRAVPDTHPVYRAQLTGRERLRAMAQLHLGFASRGPNSTRLPGKPHE